MKKQTSYTITAHIWLYPGENAVWHFLTIPKHISEDIKESTKPRPRRGWGSVRVTVTLGASTWNTSIFPDKRSGTYILPLKASVRRAEGVFDGDGVTFTIALVE